MVIKKFEDIIAWQRSQELALEVYSTFSGLRDYGFKDQIQRASVSISNNIAEGFGRRTDKDFMRFLYMALGSCNEVRSMLYLSENLKYTNAEETKVLKMKAEEIGRLTRGLIKGISNSPKSEVKSRKSGVQSPKSEVRPGKD